MKHSIRIIVLLLVPARTLHARLLAWRAEIKAPMPTKNDGDSVKPKVKGNRKKKAA